MADDPFEKKYRLFIDCYRGRKDHIAVWENGSYTCISGGLSLERFRQHLGLANRYALYQMDSSGKVCFCLFDLDVLPRNQPWSVLVKKIALEKEKALRIIANLSTFGIRQENILVEFPTVGYHVVLCFSSPISALTVKKFMQMVLVQSGLEGTPFYPRTVKTGTFGDLIQLPFRINNNTGRRSNFVQELTTFDPEAYDQNPDFSALERVQPVDADLIIRAVRNF